jgi:RNA-binding protein YhbY
MFLASVIRSQYHSLLFVVQHNMLISTQHLRPVVFIIFAWVAYCGESYMIRRVRWCAEAGRLHTASAHVQSRELVPSSDSSDIVDQWWQTTDHLLTIGSAGLTAKHINSLKNLVQEHAWVKVKLASNKMDTTGVAESVVQCEALAGTVKLLGVRGRFFAVGSDVSISRRM